ncbi:MAG: hypothetical protein VX438_07175 [Planctomycetota bacterium]|nr:hypothetical protein [Planctomycetota bacterium]
MQKLSSNAKSTQASTSLKRSFCLLILSVCLINSLAGQDPFDLPRVMDQDPEFVELKPKVVFVDQLVHLWIQALRSKDVTLQRRAAESLVIAKQRGINGLEQSHDVLIELISTSNRSRQSRIAIAKAIVAFDLKQAEKSFIQLAKTTNDFELMSVIQPALAGWKTEAARELWMQNISPECQEIRSRILAIQGLAQLGETSILDELKTMVTQANADYRLRYHSAIAIGKLVNQGLESYADKLAISKQVAERILSANVLAKHQSSRAIQILKKLAADSEPAVAFLGWSVLLNSETPRVLDPLGDLGQEHRGPKVRQKLIELLAIWQDQPAIEKLGELLADLHPQVRVSARQTLLKFAQQDSLKTWVIKAAENALEGNWQSIQQGLLILSRLDHKPAAMKLIKLLDHDRSEVHLTAGWSLEKLSVQQTLEPITRRLETQVTQIKSGDYTSMSKSRFECMSHLIQLLGKNRHRAMQEIIIRKLIPKDMNLLEYSIRPAALWSLGQIYKGKTLPDDLRELLGQRLLDDDAMNPEDTYVKSMCAYTFAVTNSRTTIEDIEKYADSNSVNSRLGFYCHWALNQLDGREIPLVKAFERQDTNWFLNPIE